MGRRRRSLLDPRGTGVFGLPTDGGAGVDALDDGDEAELMDAPLPGEGLSPPRAVPRAEGARRGPIERGPGSPNPVEPPYQPNAQPVDAPIAAELFGDAEYEAFEGLLPPPDDNVPAQVMEDVGQPYTTPFWVPDPPPIPGIVDRFTPPPAQRTDIGSRRKKPDYLAETPSVPGRYQPTPAPLTRRPLTRGQETSSQSGSQRSESARRKPGGSSGSGASVWFTVLSFLFALIGLSAFVGAAVLTLMLPRAGEEAEDGAASEQVAPGPEPAPAADPTPDPAPAGVQPEEPQPAEPSPAAPGSPARVGPLGPAPVAPVQEPASKAKAAQPAPSRPTLHVKSNRRALLYVDDEIIGYAPLEVPIEVGEHRVRAMMPGQPNSEQAKTVKVAPTSTDIRIEFTF